MILSRYILFVSSCLLLTGCQLSVPDEIKWEYQNLTGKVDFNFQVKPILSDKCFTCHGPDQQSLKADLRLDIPGSAFKKGSESGKVPIIPGNARQSHLVARILADDAEFIMPPPDSHLSLTDKEKAILIKWIDQGAQYRPHWAFLKPEKATLPVVRNVEWPRSSIDYFVLRKLEEQGYLPSAKADPEILIRRLYFNLTGLPPNRKTVETFVKSESTDAYEMLVDDLLASKAYGERMAMEWMDVARYADSDGYLDDKHRDFSPWRDWVIEAFNKNMPYDQFTTWQLAGDLIPESTQESILATAFNRLHKKNSEAGIVFEEYRTEYVADRTNTLGKAFMGLSVECARCHDHKYDPITQEEYYKMFAFFNSTNEIGTAVYGPDQTPGPALMLTDEEQEKILEYTTSKIDRKEHLLEKANTEPNPNYESWLIDRDNIISTLQDHQAEELIASFAFDKLIPESDKGNFTTPNLAGSLPATIKEPEIRPGISGKGMFLNDYTNIILPERIGWFDRTDPFSFSLYLKPDTVYQEAGILYHCEDFRLGLKGYSLYLEDNHLRFVISHTWPQNAIQVRTHAALEVNQWTQIAITYDGSSKAKGINIYLNGEKSPVAVDLDNLYKGIVYEPDIHTYGFAGFTLGNRDKMKTFKNGGIDELKIYNRQLTELEVLFDFDQLQAKQVISTAEVNTPMLREYFNLHFNKNAADLRQTLNKDREMLNHQTNNIREIMVLGDLPEPRRTFVLGRGLYNAPGDPVQPGVPEQVLPFEGDFPKNRLGLARWLFHRDHPLTSRVLVNRVWQMHFGTGLVKTPDDFGSQGAIPTHPELLDWLAVEFMESGWDIKALHKSIVMSATFQQSSKVTKEMLDQDPYNNYLARGPSYRLAAEMIRDNALAVSGLLVGKLGGASVYPYQPKGLWDEISNKTWRYKYLQEPGEGLYRRSLYTVWKRTAPPPSMLVFDARSRSVCEVNRINTSTPLQALVLLNDPQFIEAARVLAEKLLIDYPDERRTQLKEAFSASVGRTPDKKEMELMDSFYQAELKRFADQPQAAIAYTGTGEHPINQKLKPDSVAALATVINGILNTTESYTLR